MTKLHRSIDGCFVVWRYGLLRVIEVNGDLASPLKNVQELYDGAALSFRLEHDDSEELLLFRKTTPFVYARVTLIEEKALVVVQSTDRRTAKDFIDDMVRRSVLSPYSHSEEMANMIESSLRNVEIPGYESCKQAYTLIDKKGWKNFTTALTEMYYNGMFLSMSQLPEARGLRLEKPR